MTNDINGEMIAQLKELYKSNPIARKLFDWTAGRQNDASETTIDRISHKLGIARGEAVALARKLEEAGCGEFVVGRRGSKSRFVWRYSCVSLGQAAAGESSDIEDMVDATPEDDDWDEAESLDRITSLPSRMTITEAKRILAFSLGIEPSNIEITIRA